MILEPPKAGGSKVSGSKMSKKKKKPARRSRSASKSSRSESKGSERSGRSSSSSLPSSSRSLSPSLARQAYIRFEDMGKDLKNTLRVSILFVYLPNCILTDLCFTISLKLSDNWEGARK